jgi:exonuclease SbcC
MRPRRLSVAGFASFRDRTELDLDDVDYFALVGPTGHGKSTLIDAIGFALYGRVPRYDDGRVVNQVVSLGAQETRVELEFSVGADTYRVTRVVKLRNGKAKQEGRLERVLADGTTDSIAGSVRELHTAIEGILHLPFGHFTKCVALPQGEFQRFLHDKPSDRRAVLVRLLNLDVYERLGQRARELAVVHKAQADAAERELGGLGATTADAVTAATERHEALVALAGAIEAAEPVDRQLTEQAAIARAQHEQCEQLLRALAAVQVPAEADALGDHLERARREAAHALDALEVATSVRIEAEKLAGEHEPAHLEKLLDAHQRLQEEQRALADDEKSLASHAKTEQRAQAAAKKVRANLERAAQDLHEARVQHNAHALVAELRVGEPCPVCTQKVKAVPAVDTLDDVAAAQQDVEDAKQLVDQADDTVRKAARQHAAAAQAVEHRRGTIATLGDAVGEHPDADAVQAQLDTARASHEAAAGATAKERAAHRAERRARAHLDELRKQLDTLERGYTRQRDPLIALEPPAPDGEDVIASWRSLAAWAIDATETQRVTLEQLVAAAGTAASQRRELLATLAQQAAPFDVAGRTVAELLRAALRVEAQAQQAVERLRAQRARAEELGDLVARERDAHVVAAELGRLLQSDQFIDWLVVEGLAALVHGASTLLHSLSNGAYSLALDDNNEFVVVDHANADETRSVRTLSGGETFQASLALALALADQLTTLAADGAPRLEAMFLDEGFGSLDPESLDVVAATIEGLGSSGRMIGIVTHVRELAERVPVRFEVRKRGRSSSIERVVA